MAGVIVLDANVLIGLLDGDDAHHDAAESFFRAHATDRLAANVLTIAEALVRPSIAGRAATTARDLRAVGIEIIAILEDDAELVAETRATTRLRMPDAIVVFTAESLGASIATADADLQSAATARGILVHAI